MGWEKAINTTFLIQLTKHCNRSSHKFVVGVVRSFFKNLLPKKVFKRTLFYWLTDDDLRVQISSRNSSAATKNASVGLEDSGVEVGQESEQENTSGKAIATVSVHELLKRTTKQDRESTESSRRNTTEHIVFGGKGIPEAESETKKNKSQR